MAGLRLCSGTAAVKKFLKAGWLVERQKGSHVVMEKYGHEHNLSIPQHSELGRGLLRKLIKQANLSVEEFNDL
ncbi:MAG: type II toxin-antitoxin system HicA family toxin [Nitrospinae bacterium]|nr:type II toxin-antitoxin system HicA family toxin [Nitrospinota bacterium]